MNGSKPGDEWENQWLRAWRKPPEPELYDGLFDFTLRMIHNDAPGVYPLTRAGEIRQVWKATDSVCVHNIDFQVPCEECDDLRSGKATLCVSIGGNSTEAPTMKKGRWWRKLLSR